MGGLTSLRYAVPDRPGAERERVNAVDTVEKIDVVCPLFPRGDRDIFP